MNRGFSFYFRRGFTIAWRAMLKQGKYLRYYVYCLAGLIGRCIPVFGALFPVTDVRRAKLLRDEGDMAVSRAFGGVETGNAVGTTMLAVIVKWLIIAGGMLAFCAIGALLGFFGYLIGLGAGMKNPYILAGVIAAPFAIAAIVYAVGALIWYAPLAYIIDSNKDLRLSGVLTASTETMRRGGKMTCFLNAAVPFIIKAAYVALALLVTYLITFLPVSVFTFLLELFWILIAIVVFAIFAPVFTLTATVANTCLFDDIALDPASLNNRTKGLFITECKVDGALSAKGRDGTLESLFDKAEMHVEHADTRYVPPTDYVEKMRVYNPNAENAAADAQAEEKKSEYVFETPSKSNAAPNASTGNAAPNAGKYGQGGDEDEDKSDEEEYEEDSEEEYEESEEEYEDDNEEYGEEDEEEEEYEDDEDNEETGEDQ